MCHCIIFIKKVKKKQKEMHIRSVNVAKLCTFQKASNNSEPIICDLPSNFFSEREFHYRAVFINAREFAQSLEARPVIRICDTI